MAFLNNPPLLIDGRKSWRLDAELDYQAKSGKVYRVPKGFKSDLATIPRILRWLFPVNGRHRKAAILHDHLGRTGHSRSKANKLFLEAMKADRVPTWQRYPLFWGVRLYSAWLELDA
jgi:hypothetical protein